MNNTSSTDHFFQSTVLGHPSALFVLFFTEMWERFSYYGMRAILVLFLISSLDNQGWGWERKDALVLYAWYTGLVYITPIFGGLLADKFLGYRKAVVIGALLMTLGHVAMALEVFYDFFIGSEAAQLIILKNTVSPPISSESINDLGSSVESFIDSNVSLPEMYNKSGVYRVLVQLILSVFSLNAKENGTLNEVGRIEAHRAGQSYLLNWISQSS